jgi:flagellar protein FliL
MATKPETAPPPPAGDAPPPKKKRLKLLIIILAAGVVLLGAAGAALVLLTGHQEEAVAEDEEAAPKSKKKEEALNAVPVYFAMEGFTVNLLTEAGDQYLQLGITLELANPEVAERVKIFTPRLRNQVMLLLSGKKPVELAAKEGKEKLAGELKDEINAVIAPPAAKGKKVDPVVKAVLFTSFIVQ